LKQSGFSVGGVAQWSSSQPKDLKIGGLNPTEVKGFRNFHIGNAVMSWRRSAVDIQQP
jgi:hypothetical protein